MSEQIKPEDEKAVEEAKKRAEATRASGDAGHERTNGAGISHERTNGSAISHERTNGAGKPGHERTNGAGKH